MKKNKAEESKNVLDKKELEALAKWLKSDGTDAIKHAFESKSEFEKLIENMSAIDEKAIREPYMV
jgi:hypothetical protein